MTDQRNTRVKLKFYYHFPRNTETRLALVNHQTGTVQDVINHITTWFHINNFDLYINESYLTPTESINIIRDDEVILVRPNEPINVPQPASVVVTEAAESTTHTKTSKKKRKLVEVETSGSPNNKTKKRKDKNRQLSQFEPIATSSTQKNDVNVESRVQFYNNLNSFNELEHSNDDNMVQEEVADYIDNGGSNPVAHCSYSEPNEAKETKKSILNNSRLINNFTPTRSILPSSNLRKSVNVVQNIIINSGTSSTAATNATSTPENNNLCSISANQTPLCSKIDNEKFINTTENRTITNSNQKELMEIVPSSSNQKESLSTTSKETSDSVNVLKGNNGISQSILEQTPDNFGNAAMSTKMKKLLNSAVSQCLTSVRSDTSHTISSDSMEFNGNNEEAVAGNFVTRRKRVRHRKSKAKQHQDTPMPPKSHEYKKLVHAKPLIHKFFDHESSTECSSSPMALNNALLETTDLTEELDETTVPNLAQLFESTIEACDHGVNEQTNGNKSGVDREHELLSMIPESVNKFPVMTKTMLQVGNVVAFKKLKLGDGFTPEVSELIIGEVISFDGNTEEVHMKIKEGLHEFVLPVGSLNSGEDCVEEDVFQVITFKQMIEPRLLST